MREKIKSISYLYNPEFVDRLEIKDALLVGTKV
jgi:hypothetical protein